MSDDNINKVLKEFLSNSSPEEVRELEELLEKRKNSGKIDVNAIAGNMAKELHNSMGLNSDTIKESAKNIVRDMILQNDPFIEEDKLEFLVEKMVGGSAPKPDIPGPLLKEMVLHFVKYSFGEMSESEIRDLPQGWTEKYWNAFPVEVQKLIRALIKGQIGRKDFWSSIESLTR